MTRVIARVLNTKTMEYTYIRLSNGKCWHMGRGDIEALEQVKIEDAEALKEALKYHELSTIIDGHELVV